MEQEENKNTEKKGGDKPILKRIGHFHNKYYKILLLIPAILLIFSFVYMFNFNSKNHDFLYKDISLTGGTTVTLYEKIDSNKLKQDLSSQLIDLNIRDVSDLVTREQKAVIIETTSPVEQTKQVLEEYLKHPLNEKNSSIEFTGASLSESFYNQLLIAMLFAFVLMTIVVFVLFRTFIPSIAVILSAFADILMTLVTINLLGVKMSGAGIVAFLMLIGYSVDTDILLTNRILKRREGTINEKIFGAFKTGITMTLTSLFAIIISLVLTGSFSIVLNQIFTVLSIGLGFDIMNTWLTNVSILKWYVEYKEKKIIK
ncbi:MAG: protein translocase subunit SecF [Nanoarchaeota archaeon]|nr:protein translocase subunit SecF [Nanoarchaeota archaeon]